MNASRAYLIALITGLASTVIGVFSTASIWGYIITTQDIVPSSLGYLIAKAGLILCEVLFSLVFSIIAGLLIMVWNQIEKKHWIGLCAGITRLLLLILLMSIYWNTAWYYILDPNGAHPETIVIIGMGVLQGLAFLYASIHGKFSTAASGAR